MKTTKLSLALITTLGLAACGTDGDQGVQGISGLNSLVANETLALGNDECFFGGLKITTGLDTDSDNTLADSEVVSTSTNCNVNPVSVSGSPLPYSVMRADIENGAMPGSFMEVRNGGFGSDMVAHPTEPTQFYALKGEG
jgi:hypothetical protein